MNFIEGGNKFDRVCINIEEKFKQQDLELFNGLRFNKDSSTQKIKGSNKFVCLIKMYYVAILYKVKLLERLIYSNILLGWFYKFKEFWVDYLKNRPIDVIDFHFLRINYRIRFQDIAHDDENDPKKFIKSWQRYENIYSLFSSIWKYAKSQYLNFYSFLKYIPNNAHILEYGCGIAPITEGLIRYVPYKNLKFTLADIKQINFLYARWRFIQEDFINFVTISPGIADNLPSNEKYDVILCLTVFEHLPNPFEIIKVFYDHLKLGGVLIFDYIRGESKGLDTKGGQTERKKVLDFIEQNFKLLMGKINYDKSMGLTIVKRDL